MLSVIIVILIILLALFVIGWYNGVYDTRKFFLLSLIPGIGLAWLVTRPTIEELKKPEKIENVAINASGAYEEFDKEINELDFLETEEEASSKVKTANKVKTSNKGKNKKVRFKGGAEMQGILKSVVETLNENGEIAEVYDNLVKNPDEEIENVLISLNNNKDNIKNAYNNLESEKKHEIDEMLEFLENDKVEELKINLN